MNASRGKHEHSWGCSNVAGTYTMQCDCGWSLEIAAPDWEHYLIDKGAPVDDVTDILADAAVVAAIYFAQTSKQSASGHVPTPT